MDKYSPSSCWHRNPLLQNPPSRVKNPASAPYLYLFKAAVKLGTRTIASRAMMYEDGPGAGASRTSGGPRRTIDLASTRNRGLAQGPKDWALPNHLQFTFNRAESAWGVRGGGAGRAGKKIQNQRGVHYFPSVCIKRPRGEKKTQPQNKRASAKTAVSRGDQFRPAARRRVPDAALKPVARGAFRKQDVKTVLNAPAPYAIALHDQICRPRLVTIPQK